VTHSLKKPEKANLGPLEDVIERLKGTIQSKDADFKLEQSHQYQSTFDKLLGSSDGDSSKKVKQGWKRVFKNQKPQGGRR
jgi:hypothetical protein